MPVDKIAIEGYSEFVRALRKLDKDLPKMVRIANNGVADFLVDKIRPTIPVLKGNARASLKAQSTRTSARISAGGKKAPYYPWLDFGGKTGRNKSVVRPFYTEGRYVYPTLKKYSDTIAEMQYAAMADVARQAGLEVD